MAPEQILSLKICDPAMGSAAFLVEVCRQLGEHLVTAWTATNTMPKVSDDATPELLAMRTVAQRCLCGVDWNPMAVDLAKLSLWLVTLAKDHPFTFLDHALRHGDSLVGLGYQQIREFRSVPRAPRACRSPPRLPIGWGPPGRRGRPSTPWTSSPRHRPRSTRKLNFRRRSKLTSLRVYPGGMCPPPGQARGLAGYDCIVGNQPFASKNTIADGNRDGFLDWLKMTHDESHGNADHVAHFFRRAFNLLKPGGTLSLIAPHTIVQGDTRSSGLRWIWPHGDTIYQARRRYKWPGLAAVVVSVVHLVKDITSRDREGAVAAAPLPRGRGSYWLDGKPVPRITAYLFHAGGHDDPAPLRPNAGKSFIGSYVLGMGFTFDDTDKSGVANPLSLMHELIAKDPRTTERIFLHIGGEEVNDSPTHLHHRYVINFGEMTEEQARKWPDLMRIVVEKVKPERTAQSDKRAREKWRQFIRPRPELYETISGLKRNPGNCANKPNAIIFQTASTHGI